MSHNSAESEYHGLVFATAEIVWMQALLQELCVPIPTIPLLWYDNISAYHMAKNPVFHARTKHIEIDLHFIRDQVMRGKIQLHFVPIEEQPTDLLTKHLTSSRFLSLKSQLCIAPRPFHLRGDDKPRKEESFGNVYCMGNLSSSSFQWNSSFVHSKHKRDHLPSRWAAEIKDARGNILMETEFECWMEGSDFSYLFQMKQMEGFLRDINAGKVSDGSIHECIVTKAIDMMDILRKNPSLAVISKFYVSMVDVSEKVEQLYGLQRGELLILVDSLDNCYSGSVNAKVLNFFVDLLSGDLCPDLKQKIQTKFLSMDLLCLSKWLEKRLVGCAVDASEGRGIPDDATFKEDCSIDGKAIWSNKSTLEKSPGKPFSSYSIGVGPVASRPVDEDENDATSDGEVASMDKDEEDYSNSERALASKMGISFPDSDSDLAEDGCTDVDNSVSLSISRELQDGIGQIIGGKGSAFWDSPANAMAITTRDFIYVLQLLEPVDCVLLRQCESDLQVSWSRN
ncbi:Auxin transport protein BIG [Vitis vinifera]|uniref:Auxin transport protein BIG n=1 Tax=Vitis vinifera TaxID=29760 RepID=A0A438EDC1_VITVI|nr:Auxin transport protein BIG [Vitis vinifera]